MQKYLLCFVIMCMTAIFTTKASSQIHSSTDSASGITRTTKIQTDRDDEPEVAIKNMLAINPLEFIFFWNLSYYHAVTDVVGVGIGLRLPSISVIHGFGASLEARIHPSGKALRRFYVAPNFAYNHLTVGTGADEVALNTSSIGLLLGWQWFVGDAFAIGLGAGFDHFFGDVSTNADLATFSGNLPALRFDIGYGW
ncbi:MAG: hypothetical protein ABI778_01510 [Ignavibacteriota bacterium]